MGREKPLFRETLAMLDEVFPEKEYLYAEDIMKFTGIKTKRTVKKRFGVTSTGISKIKFASLLC